MSPKCALRSFAAVILWIGIAPRKAISTPAELNANLRRGSDPFKAAQEGGGIMRVVGSPGIGRWVHTSGGREIRQLR